MTSDIDILFQQSEKMFAEVAPLRSLQQELAENFYPENAQFTQVRSLGNDWASDLTTSYPLGVRRDLSNILSTMLRPQDKVWAKMTTRNFDGLDEDGKRWLEWGTLLQRNAMYDQDAGFERSMSQADDDIATFGQTVISCEMNWRKRAILFRTWPLKNCVWWENYDGTVGRVDRVWECTALDMVTIFNKSDGVQRFGVHEKVTECMAKEPFKKFPVRHMFIPIEQYDSGKGYHKRKEFKYISIFYDIENKFVMEEVPYKHEYYVVPRWKKIPGSQYAYSPAAMAALPNARLIQDMTLTVLEAGQKAVDPPMIKFGDFLRSDANLFAGGLTEADSDGFDPKLGSPLKPVYDSRTTNMSIGIDILQSVQAEMRDLFYLNKVGLPPMGSGMSQLEISQRVADYVRGALPLFSPLEPEVNGQVCSLAFNVLFNNGGFGDPRSIPESLLGKNVSFLFENPLRETAARAKGGMLLESLGVINNLAPYDPTVPMILDAPEAARDAIDGIGAPRKWFRTKEQVDVMVEGANQEAELAKTMAAVDQGANTAKTLAEANREFVETGAA